MSAQTQPAAPREDAPLGVLVGVDGSEQSVSAARWAQREAGLRGEPLTLVTAYSIPAYWGYDADAGGTVLDDSRLREGVQVLLDEVAAKLDADGVRPELRVEVGDAAGVLVDLSKAASLLVSGGRGRGGFIGRLLGSVASALPGHAHCPVAIIPAGVEASRAADGAAVEAMRLAFDTVDICGTVVIGEGERDEERERRDGHVEVDRADRGVEEALALGPLERRQHMQTAVRAVEVPGPPVAQVPIQGVRQVLLDHPHVRQVRVHQVRHRDVDQPVGPGHRQRGLDPVLRQGLQPGALSPGQDHRHRPRNAHAGPLLVVSVLPTIVVARSRDEGDRGRPVP